MALLFPLTYSYICFFLTENNLVPFTSSTSNDLKKHSMWVKSTYIDTYQYYMRISLSLTRIPWANQH